MKSLIEQKIIIGWFGLGLLMLSGVSVLSYWSLSETDYTGHLPNPILIVSIGNSCSLLILSWIYYLLIAVARNISIGKEAEAILTSNNEELELRVAERTALLKQLNQLLLDEIVDRRRAELALKSSEQQYRSLVEAIPHGIEEIDTTGTIIFSNSTYDKMLGYEQGELLGKKMWNFFPEPEHSNLPEYLAILVQQQPPPTPYLGQNLTKDGNLIDIQVDWNYKRNEQGILTGLISVITNISELKQAEKAQRKTEELYRTLSSNFPNGAVVLFDKELRYTIVEGQCLTEVGIAKDFLEGKTIWEVFPSQTCEIIEQKYRDAFEGKSTVFEIAYEKKVYLVHVLPVKNTQGEIFAGMSMTQDISERKRAEQALLEERNFVSAIVDAADVLIVVCDLQGRIVRFNRACEEITGYSFEEVKGKCGWDVFLISEDRESVKTIFQELQTGQRASHHENSWVTRDGTHRMLSWSDTVIHDADNLPKYIVGVGIDITDRKRAEEMHLALEKEKTLNELRYRFFSMVSHQFRTPLSTILITAQLLGASPDKWTEEKKIKNIFRIESAAKSLTQLLVDILTINRAESGNIEFNPTKLNIKHFCQELVAEMQNHAQPNHMMSFSSQGECKNACIDQKMLHSILKNLLLNALKYSPQGGKIHLTLNCQPGEATFQISDQGIGIPVSDQPQVFEAFYRGKNVGNISGTGLGLTVVKKCVDLHCGQIAVNSEVGVGTTFTVTIKHYQTSPKLE